MTPLFFHSPIVPAGVGRAEVINNEGALVLIKDASAVFDMRFDDGAPFPCEAGFRFRPRGGFTRLTILNKSPANDLTVSLYIGDADTQYESTRTVKTVIATTAGVLLAGESANFNGFNLSGQRRKSITVSNRHATDPLELKPKGGGATEIFAVIFGQKTELFETDADLTIKNNTAGPITYAAGEIFFSS
jgi:hypothetical protein